jgi:hypothetical protein
MWTGDHGQTKAPSRNGNGFADDDAAFGCHWISTGAGASKAFAAAGLHVVQTMINCMRSKGRLTAFFHPMHFELLGDDMNQTSYMFPIKGVYVWLHTSKIPFGKSEHVLYGFESGGRLVQKSCESAGSHSHIAQTQSCG